MKNFKLPTLASVLRTLAAVGAAVSLAAPALAAAPAGLQIGNQASATYSDGSQVTRTVTSNTVVTTVQQVASVSVQATSAKTISPGGLVYYPHTLTNTGNGTDSFNLTSSNSGSFSFVGPALFYADANGDGVPDNAIPITSTGALAMGATFKFVAAGIVPPTAISGNNNALVITATTTLPLSSANGTVTDTTTVTSQAVIAVTQSLDVTVGPSPSVSSRTITINYNNTGNTAAATLLLTELIPNGMTYVADSARWSGTGSGVILSDANLADVQGAAVNGGIIYDYGVTQTGRVTAVLTNVPAGASGTVSFKVDIKSGLAAGANAATAATVLYGYNDGSVTLNPVAANTVQYTVQSSAAVTLTGATVTSAMQGATVNFTNVVTNTGNTTDVFDLSTANVNFPVGTTFQLFQANGITPLLDANGNQVADTGPLAPNTPFTFVVKATLPPNAASGGPFTVTVKAVSGTDSSKQATATDALNSITASGVDITVGGTGSGASGFGVGPEGAPLSTPTLAPGGTTRFELYATNNSGSADSYNLAASTDGNFAATTLPAGWTVVFTDESGAVVNTTGVLLPNASKKIFADVTVPANAAGGTTQIYFRAQSPTTNATDRIHEAVAVSTLRGLTLTPNNSGQATAAGTVVYTHTITNNGSTLEGDAVLSTVTLAATNSATGFTAVVYWDKNNDGVLDPSDPVITDLSTLTGGSNGASTAAGLSIGESARLFVKVTAPAGAPVGTYNTTTLTASTTGVIATIVAPPVVSVTDSSTVITSQVTLVIMQSLDANCDGTADNATYAVTPISSGAAPGACVRYEVTATNSGPVEVTDVTVNTLTPAYTVYTITVPASATAGTVSAPADGAAGAVQTTNLSLAPGQKVVLRFGVRITP